MSKAMSFDDQTAILAEQLLGDGESDLNKGMPMSRKGDNGAEGGFTSEAGGSDIETGGQPMSENVDSAIRNEPAPKKAKAQKSEAEDDEDKDKDPVEEEEEEEEEAEKSMIDADTLIKSLEVLEAVAQGSTVPAPEDRRVELARGLAEGTLSKSEISELSDLLSKSSGSDDFEEEPEVDEPDLDEIEKSFQEGFAEDPDLAEGYEVSSFLERHSQMTAAALDQVQARLAKSLDEHRDRATAFNTQLAKSLMGLAQLAKNQDEMIKSLVDRLETVESTPMPRRGVSSHAQIISKSMPNEVGAGAASFGRQDAMSALSTMAERGMEVTKSGHRIDLAMAMAESGSPLAKSLVNDLMAFAKEG